MKIDELIALAAEQPTRISRRSGVSRSTLKRVGDGTSEPTLATLREVALALGLDIKVAAHHACDPFAAAAARTLIDASVPENPDNQEILSWLDRFERWDINDPLTLVSEAGTLQGIAYRTDAQFLKLDSMGVSALPEFFQEQKIDWALSGAATATVIMGQMLQGRSIVWHNSATKLDFSTLGTVVDSFDEADLVFIPATATELIGCYTDADLTFVAPVQLVIDLHSLHMFEEADYLTRGWR
ncbi:helix-turn-helix domain-containing protein [Corynebacterium crudilactis]|uniref:Transcriptional regulator n=1 Tax=Corynebacterium crudilactis TaxID=1652495 RepID=A0A172QW55_9CORY|nr:helix-turn-helix transcriptional regulator [Corynebacterium crudilactis]ANE04939.1 transcriptional regulator [Corynebacterium crudilactis]